MKTRVPFSDDVRIWRDRTGAVRANVRHSVVWHSPAGYGVGYAGSGPADLALNILNAFIPPGRPWNSADDDRDDIPEKCFRGYASMFAVRHHQDFKRDFIATMPDKGGVIPAAMIAAWIQTKRRAAERLKSS